MTAELHELRAYLLLPKPLRQVSPYHDRFETFLRTAQRLFSLRMAAETRFSKKRWLAKREEYALPLEWSEVALILSPTAHTPRAGLETKLARDMPPVLIRIFEDVRKLLRRSRRLVDVSQVRQLDSGCLRWLTRQPGRNVAEKAGPRQQVMGVVREEEFNTLENRVLKDFLLRVRTLTDCWLDEYRETNLKDHPAVRDVAHLNSLCVRGLALEAMEYVGTLKDLPAPNFVLQQDNRYSRLWRAYRLVIRWTRILEGLWAKRGRLESDIANFADKADALSRNRYLSELWVRPSDCREESCFEEPVCVPDAEADCLSSVPEKPSPEGLRIIDLMGERLSDVMLVPDGRHPNANYRLIDFDRPYTDFPPAEEPQNRTRVLRLCDIWQERRSDTETKRVLVLYFTQLKERLGGDRWMLLVPDDWDAEWQQTVLDAATQALSMKRDSVYLLWRSIACAIGGVDPRRTGIICCRRADGRSTTANIDYSSADKKPVRRSMLLHGYLYVIPRIDTKCAVPSLFKPCWRTDKDDTARFAEAGALQVHDDLQRGIIPYYEEQEGLFLVIQAAAEEIRFLELIPPNVECPAGREVVGSENRETHITAGDDRLMLWIQVTDQHEGDSKGSLQAYEAKFSKPVTQDETLQLRASVRPGQGVVRLQFTIPSTSKSEVLRLEDMKLLTQQMVDPVGGAPLIGATLAYIEQHMQRSFPPTSSRVYASDERWFTRRKEEPYAPAEWIPMFIKGTVTKLFSAATYNPEDHIPANQPLPPDTSPLERLCRDNVFGNIPGHRIPPSLDQQNADRFFERLAKTLSQCKIGSVQWKSCIRIIAWTYQTDLPLFDEAKRQCLSHLLTATKEKGAGISAQEFTLCANLLTRPEDWRTCMNCIHLYFSSKAEFSNGDEYLRLFYNLMQFHRDFIEQTGLYAKTEPLRCILIGLQRRYVATPAIGDYNWRSRLQGYILKCLLYLLRCRCYDGKTFLGDRDAENIKLKQDLLQVLQTTRTVRTKEKLRDTLIDYINGKGTIDGLPTA